MECCNILKDVHLVRHDVLNFSGLGFCTVYCDIVIYSPNKKNYARGTRFYETEWDFHFKSGPDYKYNRHKGQML